MEKAIIRILCLSLFLFLTNTSLFSQGGPDYTGYVQYHDGSPMSGVKAYLHNNSGTVIDSAVSDYDGSYVFYDLHPGDYSVTFTTQEDAGGIELNDAFLVEQYLSGQYELSPIQFLAADVDGNGIVDSDDYDLIWLGYLNQCNPFPVGPWVFETAFFTWPNGSREGVITKAGSSSGDVNGSLVPDPKSNSIFLENPETELIKDLSDPIEFKLSGGENLKITGMHLVIKVPDNLEIISVESPVSNTHINISGKQIRVTWMNEDHQGYEIAEGSPILVIRTKETVVSGGGNSYRLKLRDESHFLDIDGEILSGVELVLPTINVKILDEFSHTVYPNPFINYSSIDYQLPQDGQVVIELYDQTGRMVMQLENNVRPAGSYKVKIDGTSLLPGIYYYSIRYSGEDQLADTGTIIKSR